MAMEIAQVDGTLEFTLGSGGKGSEGSHVDLNVTPFNIKKEHASRIQALSKTGESLLFRRLCIDFGDEFYAFSGTRKAILPEVLEGARQDHGRRGSE